LFLVYMALQVLVRPERSLKLSSIRVQGLPVLQNVVGNLFIKWHSIYISPPLPKRQPMTIRAFSIFSSPLWQKKRVMQHSDLIFTSKYIQ